MRPTFVVLTLVTLAGAGCEGGAGEAPCASACEPWQECMAGSCAARPDRCNSYVDCDADEECDADHRCVGPTRPPAGFTDPLAGNGVTFDFRGLINDYADLTAGTSTEGLASWRVRAGETVEDLCESAYVYHRLVPPDYQDAVLAGREILAFGASRVVESSGSTLRYHHLAGAVAVEALTAMRDAQTPEAPAPAALVARLWDVTQTQRAWDRTLFRRYCLLAERAPVSQEALFVDYLHNTDFGPGEDLQVWGRIGLGEVAEITPANEDSRCAYDIDGVPATRADYEDGLAQTTPALPCDTPTGLLDAVSTESATFVFLGPINDATAGFANFETGLGTLSLTADATDYVADDYYLLAYRYAALPTTDLIVVQSLGSLAQPAPDRYTYLVFRLIVARAGLTAMAAGGQPSLAYDPAGMSAAVEWVDNKARGADAWYKVCPRLVNAPLVDDGALAACYDGTTQFLEGEDLALAGSLPMTSDATALAAAYGTTAPCFCYVNVTSNPVSCVDFDAQ